MPMRVDFRIAENGGDPIFKTLGDEVFQPLRFLVDFIPGVLQNIVKEEFQQAVMADELPGAAFSDGGKPNTPVLLIDDEGGPLRCKPLEHSRHRRGPDSESAGKSIGCDA